MLDCDYLYNEYINKKRSYYSIGKENGVSGTTISKWCRSHGITGRLPGKQFHIHDFTPEAKRFFSNHLIGDGYISLQKNGYSAAFRLTSKHSDYIDFVNKDLQSIGYKNVRSNNGILVDKSRGNITYRLETNADRGCLLQLHKDWYMRQTINGKQRNVKILPNDVLIDSTSLMYWFIEDGCYYSKGKHTRSVSLYPLCYTADEVYRLRNLLSVELCTPVNNVRVVSKKDTQSWGCGKQLSLYKKDVISDFFDYMDKCPVELESCFGYKWGSYL